MSLLVLLKNFDTQVKCEKHIERMRWPDGVTCPRCNSKSISRLRTVKKFECTKCKYQFSVTAGTIFHKTYVSLPKWFLAIYLLTSSDKKVSINQIHKDLDLPYKTVWHMSQRIKKAIGRSDFKKLVVELATAKNIE